MAVLSLAARGMQAALIDSPSLLGATLKTGGLGMTYVVRLCALITSRSISWVLCSLGETAVQEKCFHAFVELVS